MHYLCVLCAEDRKVQIQNECVDVDERDKTWLFEKKKVVLHGSQLQAEFLVHQLYIFESVCVA